MPTFVDLKTKKIIGAKKNSLTWFHEKGHIVYNTSIKGATLDYYRQSFFEATLFFICITFFINLFKWFALFSASVWMFLSLHEEIWCWIYAKKNKK